VALRESSYVRQAEGSRPRCPHDTQRGVSRAPEAGVCSIVTSIGILYTDSNIYLPRDDVIERRRDATPATI